MRKTIYACLALTVPIFSAPSHAQTVASEVTPQAPISDARVMNDDPDMGEVIGAGDGIVPFRCPIDRIRTAYQNLVNPDDALMALAIEKQTLAICRQSQEALIRIAENEMRLRELFEPIMSPPAPEPEPAPPIAQIRAPDPARNVTETLPIDLDIGLDEASAPEEAEVVVDERSEPRTAFTLGVLMRDPDGRKAILLRGEEIFTVRENEEIDEGARVLAIGDTSVTIVDAAGNEFVLE